MLAAAASAQEQQEVVVPEPSGPPVTVRGTVLNAATGQPLQRALVQIAGRQERGSLTDRQGRFTIHAVPSGVWPISITKPFVIPGTYRIVAIENGWDLDWARPEVIAHYLPNATPVTVTSKSPEAIQLSAKVAVQPR